MGHHFGEPAAEAVGFADPIALNPASFRPQQERKAVSN
jgi:hypothetical protein